MSVIPIKAHILAVDPGKISGVALFREGKFVGAAEVDVQTNDVEKWIDAALSPALTAGRTLVLVGETWGRGGARGMAQWQGLGAAWKRWDWALKDAWNKQKENGFTRPAPKTLRVHVAKWRSKVFGGRLGSEASKRMAVEMARRWYGAKLADTEHNAAEAVMIGRWALYAPEVFDAVPKKFRKE